MWQEDRRFGRTNLHRQTLFRADDIGHPKASAAAAHVHALNDDCQVEACEVALDPANVEALCEGTDVVLDCADGFAASYTLSDACEASGRPFVSASVVGVLGSLQAQMAVAVVAQLEPSPLGRLVTFDARGLRFGGFRFDGAPEPSVRPRFVAIDD